MSAIAAIAVLGSAPSASANLKASGYGGPLPTIKVREIPSATKAPDGTITARMDYKTKDPACLDKPQPYKPDSPFIELLLPAIPGNIRAAAGGGGLVHFQLQVVGRGAWALTIPPQTDVTYDDVTPEGDLIERHTTTGTAYKGFINGYIDPFHPRKGVFFWRGKSKKLGRVICYPKPERFPALGVEFNF